MQAYKVWYCWSYWK